MKSTLKQVFRRVMCLVVVLCMLSVDALAIVKEVETWGVKSINDMGFSDNRVTMDDVIASYDGYLNTSGLTEYFHKDIPELPKSGLDEAVSWLIDNKIINRDEKILVSLNTNTDIPAVAIVKADVNSYLRQDVHRSDALMYIYKSVFGPLNGRTFGIETENIRLDGSKADTLANIIERHKEEESQQNISGRGFENNTSTTKPTQGVGRGSGAEDGGEPTIKGHYTNDAMQWRYTPQGEMYTSVFGDTNIFISENHFTQDIDGGKGGDATAIDHSSATGGTGGNADAEINYETDYKSVYLIPGADVLFYQTSDVVEMYLQALYSKGLLANDKAVRQAKFYQTFDPLVADVTTYPTWSGAADPYIVNAARMTARRVEKVTPITNSNKAMSLGANFTVVTANRRNLELKRNNIFQSNTGYFSTETVERMDIYRYIYWMVSANEKKLSQLESDIVNYKYGMNLNGLASEEDKTAVKYLIALGILNFDSTHDFVNLYAPMTLGDFFTILYRVANKNARLDFSKIQLTDSDAAWQAAGFAEQTIYAVPSKQVGTVTLRGGSVHEHRDGEDTIEVQNIELGETDVPLSDSPVLTARNVVYASFPQPGEGVSVVEFGPISLANAKIDGIYGLDPSVLYDLNGRHIDSKLKDLTVGFPGLSLEQWKRDPVSEFDETNPYHQYYRLLHNIFVGYWLSTRISDSDGVRENLISTRNLTCNKSSTGSGWGGEISEEDIQYDTVAGNAIDYLLSVINDWTGADGSNAPLDITCWSIVDTNESVVDVGTTTNASNPLEGVTHITFTYRIDANSNTRATHILQLNSDADVSLQSAEGTISRYVDSNEKSARTGNEDDIKKAFAGRIDATGGAGEEVAGEAVSYVGLSVKSNGDVTYVPSTDLDSLGITVGADDISYDKGMSWLLKYNGVRAIFSNGNDTMKSTAIVGTAVITSSSDKGVAYIDKDSGVVYYSMDVIRALLDVAKETSVPNNSKDLLGLPDEAVKNNVKTYKIFNASSVQEGYISAGKFAIEDISNREDTVKFNNFAAINSATRVKNIVTKRLSFIAPGTGTQQTAFAVLTFRPVDLDSGDYSFPAITSQTNVQALLDTPVTKPTTGGVDWERNKAASNAYCNWMYGTSNATYVDTGFLAPDLHIYVLAGNGVSIAVPTDLFSSLDSVYRPTSANITQMEAINCGAVIPRHVTVPSGSAKNIPGSLRCAYWISPNKEVIITGERIYFKESLLYSLTFYNGVKNAPRLAWPADGKDLSFPVPTDDSYYRIKCGAANFAGFTVGSKFKVECKESSYVNNYDIRVVQTTSDGKVICQVGPVIGLPVSVNGNVGLASYGSNQEAKVGELNLSRVKVNGVESQNMLYKVYRDMFVSGQRRGYPGVAFKGITTTPYLSATDTNNQSVFDGTKITYYASGSPKKTINLSSVEDAAKKTLNAYAQELANKSSRNLTQSSVKMTRAYFTIEFPASSYRVSNGRLQAASSTALEFLSAEAFVSVNDLVIDGMISNAISAIPVNEVPEGSLLQIGNHWFRALGTSVDKKEFVGYVPLEVGANNASIVSASMQFAGTNIRAGSQAVNICHFFDSIALLGNTKKSDVPMATTTTEREEALQKVAEAKISTTAGEGYSVDADGNKRKMFNATGTSSGIATFYMPVCIRFQNYLLAYPTNSEAGEYAICPTAEGVGSGALAEVPFFTDTTLTTGIAVATSGYVASGYQFNPEENVLIAAMRQDFQRAFTGDLFTLARMILFVVLVWLMMAAWVCYAMRIGNLMPILESIRYPTGRREGKGIDLMRIFSLGTITMDMEFTLTRFLLYNVILAVLFVVVMLTGSVTF